VDNTAVDLVEGVVFGEDVYFLEYKIRRLQQKEWAELQAQYAEQLKRAAEEKRGVRLQRPFSMRSCFGLHSAHGHSRVATAFPCLPFPPG
jgi:hypothetical protein